MSEEKAKLSGPDLTQGVELSTIPDGTMLLGHAQEEPVLLGRRGDEVFAIGAICTHYGAPLETGLLDGHTVRRQWQRARISLRTGKALRAPVLNPVFEEHAQNAKKNCLISRALSGVDIHLRTKLL